MPVFQDFFPDVFARLYDNSGPEPHLVAEEKDGELWIATPLDLPPSNNRPPCASCPTTHARTPWKSLLCLPPTRSPAAPSAPCARPLPMSCLRTKSGASPSSNGARA